MKEWLADLSQVETAALASFVTLAVAIIAAYAVLALRDDDDDTNPLADIGDGVEVETDGGQLLSMPAPDVSNDNIATKLYRLYSHHKGKRQIGSEGYVQWILFDDTFAEPKYVKPTRKGGGIPEYEHGGETYLFPPQAMVPDEETGMRTAVHKEGDAMPLNLDVPGQPAISTDELKEYLTQRVTSSPPSWLDTLDIGAQDLLKYVIIGFIALMLGQAFLGGLF